ncbi:MAG: SAM-dependent methyltransferase [Alkalilacustris sp.]
MTPRLTDRPALLRARARAARAPALFLHAEAAVEVQERLNEVNRSFTRPAVVTGWPAAWDGVVPGARMVADDPVLALEEGAHDLIVHAMALHWADDPVGQLVQCRRALVPDGLLLAVLPGGRTLAELRAALAEAEAAVTGGLSPRVLPMAEIRDLGGLLQRAGLALPVADSLALPASYADPLALMRDLRAMGEGNALAGRLRRPTRRAVLLEAARRYAEAWPAPGGRVSATYELIFLTGWAPDAGQPQPLRPGSAKARLADALGSREQPLPDAAPGAGPGAGPDVAPGAARKS